MGQMAHFSFLNMILRRIYMDLQTLKGLLKSKVFWFNTLTIIVDASTLLTGVIPPGTLTTIVAVANIGLRVITNTDLKDK